MVRRKRRNTAPIAIDRRICASDSPHWYGTKKIRNPAPIVKMAARNFDIVTLLEEAA
jgi:hypothetical protein